MQLEAANSLLVLADREKLSTLFVGTALHVRAITVDGASAITSVTAFIKPADMNHQIALLAA